MKQWIIGDVHQIYGKVQMMASLSGEPYRWFVKKGLVSMIPLSCLGEAPNQSLDSDGKKPPQVSLIR